LTHFVVALVVMLISLGAWNWFAGLVATVVPEGLVFAAQKRLERDPDSAEKARTYFRSVAGAQLFVHGVTTFGSLVICVGSIALGLPIWATAVAFVAYVAIFRFKPIVVAGRHFMNGDAMPAKGDATPAVSEH